MLYIGMNYVGYRSKESVGQSRGAFHRWRERDKLFIINQMNPLFSLLCTDLPLCKVPGIFLRVRVSQTTTLVVLYSSLKY